MRSAIVVMAILTVTSISLGQVIVTPPNVSVYSHQTPLAPLPSSEDEKDPAYKAYRAGYSHILSEKWKEAMTALAEVRKKNPKSDYIDDAAYWSAFAQKRLDTKRGIAAFESFLAEFPNSSYYDDALAEMTDAFVVSVTGNAGNVKIRRAPGAYSYSYGSTPEASARAMRQTERAMRHVQRELRGLSPRAPRAPVVWGDVGEDDEGKKLDSKTRLKLAALQALGDNEGDKEAFITLKDMALDKTQPLILRQAAIESMEDFHKFDVENVLLQIAQGDPQEEIRLVAIYRLGDAASDKNKGLDNLITLFNGTPKGSDAQLETILYTIADVGNEKAVDFLVKVAQTHENIDIKSNAVYLLGNIGSPKARSALIQILKSK